VRKAGCHGNFLCTIRRIGDNAAADRAVQVLCPELLAGGGIEGVEIPAYIAENTTPPAVGVMAATIG
jgi:hypothetical protein